MRTRVFQSGNSQAVRIPKELQFEQLDIEYEIEREGVGVASPSENRIIITPVRLPLTNALELFAAFSDDFMSDGRPEQGTQERELL
ncbi:MAG: type II toxin-antitoxin system VapB family antitoxin [Cyanobacteria bacterium J06627_28]